VSSSYGEPLYGVTAIPAANISQLIVTPGNVQQAVINVNGALKYTAMLYPYNWDPLANGTASFATGCAQNAICPHYQPRFGHNIIYGGWGDGAIHGGPGQSALSGAEAPVVSYLDNFDMNGDKLNSVAIRSDWYRPFNPGNPMGWHPLGETANGNAARTDVIGKASYFDPNDPRREILLNADGTLCKWAAGTTPESAGCLPWFLNFDPTDPGMPLDTKWSAGTGLPQNRVTGDKTIFADLGNSWIVAGMCRCRIYGGWGNDVIDVRASTRVNNGLNDGPVSNPDGTFGTPAWETLAYGGDGQDIFFAGTGGDRLIDWVGNHNSFYVPFSQFGMPAISRTLQPFLMEFLYALSKSDGADQLLGVRYGGAPDRNGEPFGELGLVLQHDAAWHQQPGPPFNKMPENLGGVANDVQKTANIRPFGSPGTDALTGAVTAMLSLPSGDGVSMPSGTTSAGADAMPLFVTGTPGASVSYSLVQGTYRVSGTGVIGPSGTFGATADVSRFPDGLIEVTAVLSGAGPTTTLTRTIGKNSVAPVAATATAEAKITPSTQTAYSVTITAAPGQLVTVVLSDRATPIDGLTNAMEVVGPTGSLRLTFDATYLLDGTLTLSVMLTNDDGNSTTTLSESVKQLATTTALSSNASSAVTGQQITFTATISVSAETTGTRVPTGTVVFKDGATILGTATLSTTGGVTTATFTTGVLGLGAHSVTAIYGGDTYFTDSASAEVSETVTQAATSIVVSSNVNPSVFGGDVMFTAIVSVTLPGTTGAGAPTGTVTFKDGTTTLGTTAVSTSGGVTKATFSTRALGVGPHAITAVYSGDPSFIGGTSAAMNQIVNGVTWAASVRANADATTTTEQDRPALAVGANGAGYLVWSDYRTGYSDIYFTQLDAATGQRGINVKVNDGTTTARSQLNPAIAVDGGNNAYAVWQDNRGGSKCCSNDVYFSKRSATTGAWSTNLLVSPGAARNPRIAVTSSGDMAIAVWVDLRRGQVITSATFANGVWGASIRVSDASAVSPNMPDIAIGPDGTAYVVWEDSRNGGRDVYSATLARGATGWSANVKVSDGPAATDQYAARVAVDASGSAMTIWLDGRGGMQQQVRMSQRLGLSGTWQLASSVVSDSVARPQQQLALAVAPGGRAFAAWQDAREGTWRVWGSLYDPGLRAWSDSRQSGETNAAQNPTVAMTNTVVFIAYGEVTSMDVDVRARRGTIGP
jgi:hypothetical protein